MQNYILVKKFHSKIKLQQLQKPKFDKPNFVNSEVGKTIDTKTSKIFDITQEMKQKDMDDIP
ncbi:hypothetical protein EJB10_00020 [Wolbachia endosymbiont of Brugia malayi]|uniref:hypothetical protein n=1 Tax=Wolbachia endosymbiont of Brugia malayi TaxID=80849 RepID=UPI00004C940F|nr:hypothetical protein [Wolbachia endosymbiont of Brugia malayi]AAW71103.1 Predicted protein [Wolbachia endosymbiont strain TRS of Brugia malayi]QCB61309.1 hypothetical protein EJB10_00020 [Wolbachia endosymbiont of Brugia malayi]